MDDTGQDDDQFPDSDPSVEDSSDESEILQLGLPLPHRFILPAEVVAVTGDVNLILPTGGYDASTFRYLIMVGFACLNSGSLDGCSAILLELLIAVRSSRPKNAHKKFTSLRDLLLRAFQIVRSFHFHSKRSLFQMPASASLPHHFDPMPASALMSHVPMPASATMSHDVQMSASATESHHFDPMPASAIMSQTVKVQSVIDPSQVVRNRVQCLFFEATRVCRLTSLPDKTKVKEGTQVGNCVMPGFSKTPVPVRALSAASDITADVPISNLSLKGRTVRVSPNAVSE